MFETIFSILVCILLLSIVYFGASVFVYMTVFGFDVKTALKKAAREFLFWKDLNNNDKNENN